MNPFVWIVCESYGAVDWLQNLALTNFHKTLRCDDGDAQTTNGICDSGACQGCPIVSSECDSGTWDLSSSQCSALLPPDGTACGAGGTCVAGVCTGACGRRAHLGRIYSNPILMYNFQFCTRTFSLPWYLAAPATPRPVGAMQTTGRRVSERSQITLVRHSKIPNYTSKIDESIRLDSS